MKVEYTIEIVKDFNGGRVIEVFFILNVVIK